jgi:hypothetical protein
VGVVVWPDEVDELFGGDLVVAIGLPTPKGGVVLSTVTPIGLRDREAGTVSFTTSLGFGRKLERIAADPRIAVAYATRQHGHAQRPGVAVVQGVASVPPAPTEAERAELKARGAQFLGQVVSGPFWDRWLSVYYYDRVLVDVAVQRVLWWPDADLGAAPQVIGGALPGGPSPSQPPPRDPEAPRVPMRLVRRWAAKPHRLLGALLADGMPLVLPVAVDAIDETGLSLSVPPALRQRGGRRAGLIFHDFRPGLVGLATATHTGWLTDDGATVRWTPHTRHSFMAPPNKTLLLLGNGLAARWGYWRARRQGRHLILRHGQTTTR